MFTIPGPFADNIPMASFHLWQWARTQARADVTVNKYLDSLGFVVGTDRLTESQYDTLQSVCRHYHDVAPHLANPVQFSALFTPVESGGFWVQGKPGRYLPTDLTRETLQGVGWIYEITPDTTFFAVIQNRIYAKYQQILGSRNIATLKED